MEFVLFFIGFLAASGSAGLYYKIKIQPKLKAKIAQDEALKVQEEELKKNICFMEKERYGLENLIQERQLESEILQEDIQRKSLQQQLLEKSYLESEQKLRAEHQEMATMLGEAFAQVAETNRVEYEKQIEMYKKEYLDVMAGLTDHLNIELEEKKEKVSKEEEKLESLRCKVNAATEADRRALEMKEKEKFYKLQIAATDLEEISRLRQVLPQLRDQEPLNKVIWKTYYEQPSNELTGRVVGTAVKTGIYKITNLLNGRCYVGQSTDIANRWKQHIKRGIGAEPSTHNKLYPAMLNDGVENFSFEIIEECDKSLLNEREQFWQDFYNAKTFGYSIK